MSKILEMMENKENLKIVTQIGICTCFVWLCVFGMWCLNAHARPCQTLYLNIPDDSH